MVKIVLRKTGFCLSACETSETELCKVDLLSEKKLIENDFLSVFLQNLKTENFNYTPCRFKISLFNKNYDDIVNILRSGAISGIKAIENIQNSGFPDLSLKFVNDPKQKFYLALQSGKLEEASAAADLLKDKLYYDKLAEKAMLIGKLNVIYNKIGC